MLSVCVEKVKVIDPRNVPVSVWRRGRSRARQPCRTHPVPDEHGFIGVLVGAGATGHVLNPIQALGSHLVAERTWGSLKLKKGSGRMNKRLWELHLICDTKLCIQSIARPVRSLVLPALTCIRFTGLHNRYWFHLYYLFLLSLGNDMFPYCFCSCSLSLCAGCPDPLGKVREQGSSW